MTRLYVSNIANMEEVFSIILLVSINEANMFYFIKNETCIQWFKINFISLSRVFRKKMQN